MSNTTIENNSLGDTDPVHTIGFDTIEDSAIDMTEVINYDLQTKTAKMVSGIEHYVTTGNMDATTALYLGVKTNFNKLDPLSSSYNSRYGGEGFFSSALDMLEKGILTIIRFIKKILIWCVDKVKQFFGFAPSDRQAAIINDAMPAFKAEMASYFTALGFPVNLLSIDRYLDSLPADKRRIAQVTYLTTKVNDDQQYFENFGLIPPLIQKTLKTIGDCARKAKERKQRFSRSLDQLVNKAKNKQVNLNDDAENLIEQMSQVIQALDYKSIIPALNELSQFITEKAIKEDDDASQIAIAISKEINEATETAKTFANAEFVKKIEQVLTKVTVDNLMNLKSQTKEIKDIFGELFDVVNEGELVKIRRLSEISNDKRYLGFYQQMTSNLNAFTSFTQSVIEILRKATKTFDDLSKWYKEVHHFMLAMVADDVQKVCGHMLKAQQEHIRTGQTFPVDITVTGIPKNLVLMSDADAQTALEKMSHISKEMVEVNLLGIKDSINNFSKQANLGVRM